MIRVSLAILVWPTRAAAWLLKWIQKHSGAKQAGFNAIISNYITRVNRSWDAFYVDEVSSPEGGERLVYLDVGARQGEIDVVRRNKGLFEKIILVEGEEEEARRLRGEGYLVIDKFLTDKPGRGTFYHVVENPGASSLKKPLGPYFDLYCYGDDNAHYKMHARQKEIPILASTADIELKKLGVDRVDLAKLDVQGAELDILNGMRDYRPLFWIVELEYLPMYYDMPYGIEVEREMQRRGYLKFHDGDKQFREGMLQWSDGYFMPDWTKLEGEKLIRENQARWQLLMRIFAQHKILSFVKKKLSLA